MSVIYKGVQYIYILSTKNNIISFIFYCTLFNDFYFS